MSRTIRCTRGNNRAGWYRDWTKAFGFNWEYAGHPDYHEMGAGMTMRNDYYIRECSPRERAKQLLIQCGESRHANARSPGKRYRWYREEELRTHNKQELRKELMRDDYEGLYRATPNSCWWDWS